MKTYVWESLSNASDALDQGQALNSPPTICTDGSGFTSVESPLEETRVATRIVCIQSQSIPGCRFFTHSKHSAGSAMQSAVTYTSTSAGGTSYASDAFDQIPCAVRDSNRESPIRCARSDLVESGRSGRLISVILLSRRPPGHEERFVTSQSSAPEHDEGRTSW